MTTQLELFPQPPVRDPSDAVRILLDALSHGEWEYARTLTARTGLDDREVRDCRFYAGGRIISGNKGYRLTAASTQEERYHYRRRWWAQIHSMQQALLEFEEYERKTFGP